MEIKKIYNLIKNINKEFGVPFLPKDFVNAKFNDSGLSLRIGKRDILFDKDFNVIGAGMVKEE